MNFNYGYNFDVRTAKVDEKKKEEKKEKEEVTDKPQTPVTSEEVVTLTGNALEMQAVLAKATVQGANPTHNGKSDPEEWEQMWEDYQQLKAAYELEEEHMEYEEKINALNDLQRELMNILGGGFNIPDGFLEQIESELLDVTSDKVNAMNEAYIDGSMNEQDKIEMLEQIESDLSLFDELSGINESSIANGHKLAVLNTIGHLIENILGDEEPGGNLWGDAHTLQAQVIFAEVDVMQSIYSDSEAQMSWGDKWAYLESIDNKLNEINNHGGYGDDQDEINSWYGSEVDQILGDKWKLIEELADNIEQNQYIGGFKDSIENVINNYDLDNVTIHKLMEKYANAYNSQAEAAMEQMNNPPQQGSTYTNAQNFLAKVEIIDTHYEFIFEHQSDGQNYQFFTQQVTQNEAILGALRRYRDALAGAAKSTRQDQDIIAELNAQIARFEEALRQANAYLRQIPIRFANLNQPAVQ